MAETTPAAIKDEIRREAFGRRDALDRDWRRGAARAIASRRSRAFRSSMTAWSDTTSPSRAAESRQTNKVRSRDGRGSSIPGSLRK